MIEYKRVSVGGLAHMNPSIRMQGRIWIYLWSSSVGFQIFCNLKIIC